MGITKTVDKINRKYYWINMYSDVKRWIKTCPECQARKRSFGKKIGLLQPISVDRVFQRFVIDVAGPWPETPRGNRFMLLGIDAMSGWPEAISLKNISSWLVSQFLATEVVTRHGLMELLIYDQGKNLVLSEIIQDLSAILGIQVKTLLHTILKGMVKLKDTCRQLKTLSNLSYLKINGIGISCYHMH